MNRNTRIGMGIALIVFVIDQIVKYWVTGPLGIDRPGTGMAVVSFFDLRFVPNPGVSLGLFAADSEAMRWGLVAVTAAIACGVVVWMLREKSRQDVLALSLVLGGALGNIVDRVRLGYVVDYADLHFGEWRPFLVFNVADAAITIGVLILLVRALLVRDKAVDDKQADDAPVENINA